MSPCSPACGRALRRSLLTRKANGCSSGRRSCRADEEGYSFIEPPTLFFTLSFYTWSMLRYACIKPNDMSSFEYPLLLLHVDRTACYLQNNIGCRTRMRTGKPGTAGDPTSANGNGYRPRGLFARWDSLGLPPARPGPLARLPLGRGRPVGHQRRP